jgi:Amidohydrolase
MSAGQHAVSIPVIDMWAPIVPSDEIIEDLQSGFPTEQLQYLEVFTKTTVSDEQFGSYAQALRRSDDQILAALDEAGITHSLITGFDERSTCGVTFVHNESVAALTDRHPNRFVPFAGADIMRGSSALAELEHWVVGRGFRGLSLRPFMIGRPATDRAYFPFYAKCVELGIPLSIHTSANWTRTRASDLGHPRDIDGRLPLSRADDPDEPRRLPVGAGGMFGRVEASERVFGARSPPPQILCRCGRRMGSVDAVRSDDDPRQGRVRHRRFSDQPTLCAAL